ncbi:MAG: hypothetical protein JEY97_05665 [Bacteroidales bacterium]|nr:hypothetical protein [Bacteroidales bacterium]
MNETQRPDFYILSEKDWGDFVRKKEKSYNEKHPDRKTVIENNILILSDEINKQGNPYKGCGVKPKEIEIFKENWDIILNECKKSLK